MTEPLKNQFGADIPAKIARMIHAVYPRFQSQAFSRQVLDGYEPLGLTQRGWKIARALRKHLPGDYPEAVAILVSSLGKKHESTESFGMAPFLYMPHVFFVAEFGLDHFEPSMQAQYELTQRFSAEFSIRNFLIRFPQKTLKQLDRWTRDQSPHVRRLVSEGTRPRLPWAPRLRDFQRDPAPVLKLLEKLKDDPELYVRRSVANNLNDIGKDHPDVLVSVARRWLRDANSDREWIVRHALRSAVKRGVAGALEILGFGGKPQVAIDNLSLKPKRPKIGQAVTFALTLTNTGSRRQSMMVDYQVHYVKARGSTSPKVFKLKTLEVEPGQSVDMTKNISLDDKTTRKHYPGRHSVDLLINGVTFSLGEFQLVK